MDPLLKHLREEFEEVLKAVRTDNAGRADWLCRKAIEHIDEKSRENASFAALIGDLAESASDEGCDRGLAVVDTERVNALMTAVGMEPKFEPCP